jgi:hypothetical protein
MLSWEDDVEAHALRKRGWSISAIARHLGTTARRSAGTCAATAGRAGGPAGARR